MFHKSTELMNGVFSIYIAAGIVTWGFGLWCGIEEIKHHGYMIWVVGILLELVSLLIQRINKHKFKHYLGWFSLIISVVAYMAILFINKPLIPLWLHAVLMSTIPVVMVLGSKHLNKESK